MRDGHGCASLSIVGMLSYDLIRAQHFPVCGILIHARNVHESTLNVAGVYICVVHTWLKTQVHIGMCLETLKFTNY